MLQGRDAASWEHYNPGCASQFGVESIRRLTHWRSKKVAVQPAFGREGRWMIQWERGDGSNTTENRRRSPAESISLARIWSALHRL